ncbi:monofunctional biosynthetic peptidoglycan transglycosylase [Dysgonomonas sp. 216]|uniref:monofunctional biosynthetic peptidoglycan transglycosylase n=1 Tax=Dysgonomonas sp. 216 TaxID=2302934 RepID=UPI0013D3F0F9|nr:monofunctional biosynthetic peptidoglycan transglycosylase [Dysgonomonas sp. 216]NDW18343.1 monofunctional biosynthetic peptidoglycan transglycosylase [Dysgonomonas sp. 216]NDW18711.1 monofunctional biosynthetic peptidoglycan transglycosylase [Dysgonomonas sp. 216]
MKRIFKWVRNIILFLFLFSILQVVLAKYVPVYITPLMVIRTIEQLRTDKPVKLQHKWVSIDNISPHLPQAVVASEDNLFLEHSGFDFKQIEIARKDAEEGKRARGASTISQQTAKNVFLWHGRSFVRKGLEAYYTVLIELVWGKKRIMEVYLNSIEMGEGVYGAEAVAQAHFNKPAKDLTKEESAVIAATLPNPRRFNSAKPSRYILKRKDKILSLMDKIKPVKFD